MMKPYKILPLKVVAAILVFSFSAVHAQVKIGNNLGTISSNSILELESTNKGFLPPRVTLTRTDTVAPMSGTVASGMLIYNTGGSLAEGYYYWNGTKWLSVASSAGARSNHVIVKSAADFPAPVSGVITLVAGTVYEVNGMVMMTSKINLNNSFLTGKDHLYDQLIYTPASGELLTGSVGGSIKSLMLIAPTPGSKLFNIDGGGADVTLFMRDCLIGLCHSVGILKNFGNVIIIENTGFYGNTTGITYQDDYAVLENSLNWNKDNTGVFETFVGSFTVIHRIGGVYFPLSGATAMNISGITSLASGVLKSSSFIGTGTYVTGTFSKQWEVEATGINSERDAEASGNLYITTPSSSSISAMNVPVKFAGTTVSASLMRVLMPVNNRLTYKGTKTRRFQAICSVTATAVSSNRNFSFHIYRNGVKLSESTQAMKMGSNVNTASLTLSCTVLLAPDDYVEVWVENDSDNSDITATNLNLSIK